MVSPDDAFPPMKVGIVLPQTGQQATKHYVIELALKSEKEGFDSLFAFGRSFFPSSISISNLFLLLRRPSLKLCMHYLLCNQPDQGYNL
jgi:hypothetical protein